MGCGPGHWELGTVPTLCSPDSATAGFLLRLGSFLAIEWEAAEERRQTVDKEGVLVPGEGAQEARRGFLEVMGKRLAQAALFIGAHPKQVSCLRPASQPFYTVRCLAGFLLLAADC